MPTAVIVEDELPAARRLKRMALDCALEVQAVLHSVDEAVSWFRQHLHPDLVLLDVQLSDGLGFDIFEQVAIRSAVVFITAYDEFALRAFTLKSVDYLLKPINLEALQQAMPLGGGLRRLARAPESVQALSEALDHPRGQRHQDSSTFARNRLLQPA